MEFQKSDVYNIIKKVKIENLDIDYVQSMPEKFTKLPCISYCNFNNSLKYSFKNKIFSQTMSVQIDIWSKSSSINTLILKQLTDIMLQEGWQLSIAEDMDKKGNVFRIMTKFRRIV